jgi:hypothetical protein
LEPGARARSTNLQAKAEGISTPLFSASTRRGPFSLRRGLESISVFFKLSITSLV